jgi:hypothetical protein
VFVYCGLGAGPPPGTPNLKIIFVKVNFYFLSVKRADTSELQQARHNPFREPARTRTKQAAAFASPALALTEEEGEENEAAP